MKMLKTLAVVLCALSLAACASPDYEQYSKAQVNITTAKHQADAAKYKALSDIASSGDSTATIEWEYSQEVQRHNGFVSLIGPALGLTEETTDDLFILAKTL